MGELCNLAKLFTVTGAYTVLVFNVGWVGLVCVGVRADDGLAGLVVSVAQSVTHNFNSIKFTWHFECVAIARATYGIRS